MQVLWQAARIAMVGLCLGLLWGLVMGFPALPAPEAAVCLPPGTEPDPGTVSVRWVSQSEAHDRLDEAGVAFVDARPLEEFHAGHVSGAISAPMEHGTLADDVLAQLRGAAIVVAYCDTSDGCTRSTRLAGLLAAAGLPDVRVLEGGMPAWLDNGYAAEAGACHRCP